MGSNIMLAHGETGSDQNTPSFPSETQANETESISPLADIRFFEFLAISTVDAGEIVTPLEMQNLEIDLEHTVNHDSEENK